MQTVLCLLVVAFCVAAEAQRGGRGDNRGDHRGNNSGPRNANGTESERPARPFGNVLGRIFGGGRSLDPTQTAGDAAAVPADAVPQGGLGRPGRIGGRGDRGNARAGPNKHRGEESRPNRFGFGLVGGDVSVWNRTVGANEVSQMAMTQDAESKVVLLNFDSRMENAGLDRASILYDGSTALPITIIKVHGACFLIPTADGITYASISADIISRNGTTVTAVLGESLFTAIGLEMSQADRTVLEDGNVNVQLFCANYALFDTAPTDAASIPDAAAVPAGQKIFSVLSLDSEVTILAEDRPQARPVNREQFRNRFQTRRGDRRGFRTTTPKP